MSRVNEVRVRLTDSELEQLDELRGSIPRAVWLRNAVQRPPEVVDVASREESLAILTAMAREGKQQAAIALERALRGDSGDSDDPLEALLRAK
jgi:hypothetical protein